MIKMKIIKDKKLKVSFINKRFESHSTMCVILKHFYGLNHFLIKKMFQKFGLPLSIRYKDIKRSLILRIEHFVSL